jgi:hypothetical protein
MDVIRAADPKREHLALKRLQGISESNSFTSIIAKSTIQEPPTTSSLTRTSLPSLARHKIESQKSIGLDFEAAMLSSLIENMFTTQSDSAFGSGVAGSSFKSLFAQQIASQVVRSGGLGIAALVERHRELRETTGNRV